jgi:ABC-type nitrate/sulfonate/bicarbonate transport system substrate-binding protein
MDEMEQALAEVTQAAEAMRAALAKVAAIEVPGVAQSRNVAIAQRRLSANLDMVLGPEGSIDYVRDFCVRVRYWVAFRHPKT